MKEEKVTRRRFIKTTSLTAGAGVGLTGLLGCAPKTKALPSIARIGPNESIRIAVVGIRGMGQNHIKAYQSLPKVEVAALCDINTEVLAETGKAFGLGNDALFTDYDKFVGSDIDMVMIATPIPYHTEQTLKALDAGKHVLCEQTMAYTVDECEQVVNAVKKSGLVYMMAENYTYFHYIRQWKKMIDNGRLGEIYYGEAEYIHEIVPLLEKEDGSFFWRAERPPIWYCAHCLGPLLTLMDDRVTKATGAHSGFHRFPERTDKPGFLDMEVGLFMTEKGKTIKILRRQTPVRTHMVYYNLYGTKGSVENGRLGEGGVCYIPDEMGEEKNAETMKYSTVDPDAPEEAKSGGHGASEYYMIRDFIEAVKNGTRPPLDVMRAADFTIPGIIAHEAAMKGGVWMDVPVFNW